MAAEELGRAKLRCGKKKERRREDKYGRVVRNLEEVREA